MRRYITSLREWFVTLISGKPHFYIGGRERPYMLRWYLIPRNRWFNLYLHKFMRDDDDRALHDHPWWFVSIMLSGQYLETRNQIIEGDCFQCEQINERVRSFPSIAFRRATDQHRVSLAKDSTGKPLPCWTLVITGRVSRKWGFWCPKGFVPWDQFVNLDSPGEIGPGCGEI